MRYDGLAVNHFNCAERTRSPPQPRFALFGPFQSSRHFCLTTVPQAQRHIAVSNPTQRNSLAGISVIGFEVAGLGDGINCGLAVFSFGYDGGLD